MRNASCCVPLCTNTLRNSPGLAFYRIPKARRIQREYERLLRNGNWKLKPSLKLFHGAFFWFFLDKKSAQVHLPSVSVTFSFNSTFRFAIFSFFNPAETFHAMFFNVGVRPNNPINARAPSLGPRLLLFSKVSYITNRIN